MPNENTVFTPSSILFRPHHQATFWLLSDLVVEAPGTAPGSEWFIAQAIYRHSQQADTINIDTNQHFSKSVIELQLQNLGCLKRGDEWQGI